MILTYSYFFILFIINTNNNWIELFNGKDLEGWEVKINGYELGKNHKHTFKVKDGVIQVSYQNYRKFGGKFGHLFYTKKKFKNYILRLDYRFFGNHLKGAPEWSIKNSGVMLHSQDPKIMLKKQEFPVSVEAQLLGGLNAGKRSTGNVCTPGIDVDIKGFKAINHCVNSTSKTYNNDDWINIELIVYSDSLIHHVIETDTILTYTNMRIGGEFIPKNYLDKLGESLESGFISLQSEGHPIEFKNIKIREIF